MKTPAVYLLSNRKNGTLFVGATEDVVATVAGHKEGRIWGFAKKYNLTKLVYVETFGAVDEAVKRTEQIKRFKRQEKIKMIEEKNPYWTDVYRELAKAE